MDPIVFTSKLTAYDSSMDYLITFYDNLPYVRNWDYCNESTIGLQSGNVIKFFQYSLNNPVVIENHDDLTALYLQKLKDKMDSDNMVTVLDESGHAIPDREESEDAIPILDEME